jgi:hypothetical protein
MKLLGKTRGGVAAFLGAGDQKAATAFVLAVEARLVKLGVLVDGLGSGNGVALLRGIVYDSGGTLLAVSNEVAVPSGMPLGWLDLTFPVLPAATLAQGTYRLGVIFGGSPNVARVWGDVDATNPTNFNTDTYSDGPSATFGAPTAFGAALAIYATYTSAWASPERPEAELARLPWAESQAIFAQSGVVASTIQNGVLGWYGTAFDDERGAFAVVRPDGQFGDLVGERLAISSGDRTVYCFCKSALPLNEGEDLAVPSRVYAALSLLAQVPLEVTVEVLS